MSGSDVKVLTNTLLSKKREPYHSFIINFVVFYKTFLAACIDPPCGEHSHCSEPNQCTCDEGYQQASGQCVGEY